jgi:AraC-like DNA-binding protein
MLRSNARRPRRVVPRMSFSSTLVHRAEIRFHEPAPSLRSFVGCFWVITADRGARIRVVPDGSTAISAQCPRNEPARWILRGPLVRPDERQFRAPATVVGVRLRPGVAFLLTGTPARAIVGRRVTFDLPAFAELVSGKPSPSTPEQCIDALQRFLIRRLEGAKVDAVVSSAIHEIERELGCVRVSELARRSGVSPRHLNRLMQAWVGYGPKCFASVVRFQEALKHMEHAPGQSGAALASDTGYFDQSHLTLDLARFAGATPGHLASRCVADFSKTRCVDPP